MKMGKRCVMHHRHFYYTALCTQSCIRKGVGLLHFAWGLGNNLYRRASSLPRGTYPFETLEIKCSCSSSSWICSWLSLAQRITVLYVYSTGRKQDTPC